MLSQYLELKLDYTKLDLVSPDTSTMLHISACKVSIPSRGVQITKHAISDLLIH